MMLLAIDLAIPLMFGFSPLTWKLELNTTYALNEG
jgi:hypothetical protein